MMNFLPLCRATIQDQRVNKGGYRFGIKNRKADVMCYKRIRFHFLSISVLIFNLTLTGCPKDEILDQYNKVVQTAGNTALTSDFSLKGNRTYGEDCYTGTYTADYKDFSKTEYLFGGTSIERENGKDISVSCDLEIRAFRNEYRIIICRTTAKEKKPSFLLVQKRESLPKDMAAKGVSRHESATINTGISRLFTTRKGAKTMSEKRREICLQIYRYFW